MSQKDLIKYMPDGQGLVFDPNPVVTSGNNTLRDPEATPTACGFSGTARATIDAQRVTRTLRDITKAGGKHKLEGPYCKIRNFGAPNIAPPEETSANAFNYSSGDADRRFEAVNVYYHVDTLQRYVQSLGITNANNRQVECDPYDNSINAAWYSSADKGLHFSDSGSCRPDRGEDGEVMFHEYGHAMQDNQVPGWGGTNPTTGRNETGAMGEGFGDTLACVYFAPEHPFQREFFEDWIFGDTPIGCLRRVDGTKVYPTNWAGSVHADGEIWSAALWNIYRAIGGDSMNIVERQAARDALLKTVILSHFSVPANGMMPDGAEAVMETHADLSEYRGQYLMQMLDSFHTRGLLPCSPQADLYIREDASDPGVDLFTGPVFWNSPDLWIRNVDDNGTAHQNPEAGQDNWFYARVRNRGTATARAFVVTFNVKPWAGVQFTYPNDFVSFISAAVGFNLPAGGSTIVKAKWPASLVPPTGTHACWLVSAYTPVDTTAVGRHVWESNNLAQKNLTIVNLKPDTSTVIKFQLGNLQAINPERFRIELRRPRAWSTMPVAIVHENPEMVRALARSIEEIPIVVQPVVQPSRFVRFLEPARIELGARGVALNPVSMTLGRDSMLDLDAVTTVQQLDALTAEYEADLIEDAGIATLAFKPSLNAGFPVVLRPRTQIEFGLKVAAPANARPGDEILIHLYQRNEKNQVVGGISIQVSVV
ncbi:MAG: M36 family metallopeptidase [Nitrosomonas sp.]|uniref:M36 family metallopeptidase n=1 Tax=Nitrosomonas sp. TaxID=42353 RepID=UPI002734268D|nr:M36 family metallopeptidase [Nitrosomonas sp.]MDP3280444.1 M36 family metallopeptidase [Nitrosomonas sp.]